MVIPGATPPPQRRAGGPTHFGPHEWVACIAKGRRSTAYVVVPEGQTQASVLRVAQAEFEAQLREERSEFPWVEAHGRAGSLHDLVLGENLSTVLDHFVQQNRALPLPMALTIAMGISKQLSARSKPHLDLVPHHVLLGYDGTIHLIDPAPAPTHDLSRQSYRAPEHVQGTPADAATDVFALGILLFEMTTGSQLFDPNSPDFEQKVADARVPRPRDIVGDGYPIELQLVLRKLMRPAKAGRFATAAAAHDALRLVATTRADIGPGPLASWLASALPERKAAWADLISEHSQLEPAGPTATRPQAPPRAPTRPSSYLGSTQPTIEELRIDSPTVQAVRRQILADAEVTTPPDREQLALRAEVEKMKSRRTELVAIPTASAEITQPGTNLPQALNAEDTFEDLDVPTLKAAAKPRIKPQGLASSPPPMMVPELPTEISRRFAHIVPQSLGLEPPDSKTATSLDELVGPSEPLIASDLLESGLDLVPAPPPMSLTDPPAPQARPEFGLAEGVQAGSLADLGPDSPMEREDAIALPEPFGPNAAPGLSADLLLGEPDVPAKPGPLPRWASQLQTPAAQAEAPPPVLEPTEDSGDTVQDEAVDNLLESDDLRLLQRAVQIEVPDNNDPHAQVTLQDDMLSPFPQLAKAVLPDTADADDADSEATLPPEADTLAPKLPTAEPATLQPAAPLPEPQRDLGVSNPPNYGERGIATQVVRDRIVDDLQTPESLPAASQPTPLNLPEEAFTPLAPAKDSQPPRNLVEDEESSAHLVIPISDADLKKSQRRRLWYWIVPLAGVAVVLSALLIVQFLRAPVKVPADRELPAKHDPIVTPPAKVAPEEAAEVPAAEAPAEATEVLAAEMPAEPTEAPPPEPAEVAQPSGESLSERPAPRPSPRRRRSATAPVVTEDPIQTWILRIHALPEDSVIEVEGDRVASASIVMLSGATPARVKIAHAGYQTLTATITPAARVERHFILRKLR